jgi:K+-sensing histidine kinase KdpD
MSDSLAGERTPLESSGRPDDGQQAAQSDEAGQMPLGAQYAVSLLFVAVATALAFVVEHLVPAPNLSLIFVLPVVIAATGFGWGPALAAVVAGVLAFDFFFTEPLYSFRIASSSDLWAAGLLLVIAAIVSTVAAESRRRAVQARWAAGQAQALQALAHVVIEGDPQAEVLKAAATALTKIFRAPSVIFMEQSGSLRSVASAGGAEITGAEEAAAKGVLEANIAARAETYPFDRSRFDVWPVAAGPNRRFAIGVDFTRARRERPARPERFVEIVGGYLASALGA